MQNLSLTKRLINFQLSSHAVEKNRYSENNGHHHFVENHLLCPRLLLPDSYGSMPPPKYNRQPGKTLLTLIALSEAFLLCLKDASDQDSSNEMRRLYNAYSNYPGQNVMSPEEKLALNRLQYEMMANYVQNR